MSWQRLRRVRRCPSCLSLRVWSPATRAGLWSCSKPRCDLVFDLLCTAPSKPRCNLVFDLLCTALSKPRCNLVFDLLCTALSKPRCNLVFDLLCTTLSKPRCDDPALQSTVHNSKEAVLSSSYLISQPLESANFLSIPIPISIIIPRFIPIPIPRPVVPVP